MLIKLLINLFLISTFLSSQEIDLLSLEKQNRSIKKDFYILKYLQEENTSPLDAIKALGMAKEVKNKLFFAYANRLKHDETLAVSQCMQSDISFLINSYADCIVAGLSIKEASTLNVLQLDAIISKTNQKYKEFSSILKIINSPLPFSKLISSNKDIIYQVYLNVSDDFLFNKLNYRLPKSTLKKIKNDSRFALLLKRIVKNNKMTLAQKSFYLLEKENLNFEASFVLFLNLFQNNKQEEALSALNKLSLKDLSIEENNKVLYFKYLITKDKTLLESIIKSKYIDIYSISSFEILNIKINKETFKTYMNPYKMELKEYSLKKKVLFLSLIKELSAFDSSLVKDEYKLGLTQINLELFKELNIKYEKEHKIEELFNISTSIKYLDYKLDSLGVYKEKEDILSLLSYFADINKDDFTKSLGTFFISLEQNKHFKNILVNFIAYNKILLNKDIKLNSLFKK